MALNPNITINSSLDFTVALPTGVTTTEQSVVSITLGDVPLNLNNSTKVIAGQNSLTVYLDSNDPLKFDELYRVSISNLSDTSNFVEDFSTSDYNLLSISNYTDLSFDLSLAKGFIFDSSDIPVVTIKKLDNSLAELPISFSNEVKFFNHNNLSTITIFLAESNKEFFTEGSTYKISATFANSYEFTTNLVMTEFSKILVDDCSIMATGNRLIEIEFKGSIKNLGSTNTLINPGIESLTNFYISFFGQDPESKDTKSSVGYITTQSFDFSVSKLNNKLLIQSKYNLPVPNSNVGDYHHDMIINSIKISNDLSPLTDSKDRVLDLTILPFNPTQSSNETKVKLNTSNDPEVTALSNTKVSVEFTQPVTTLEKNVFVDRTVKEIERDKDSLSKVYYSLDDNSAITATSTELKLGDNKLTDAYGLYVQPFTTTLTAPSVNPTIETVKQDINTVNTTKLVITFSAAMDKISTSDISKYVLDTNVDPTTPITDATIEADSKDEKVFYVTFEKPLASNTYYFSADAAQANTIMDKYGNSLTANAVQCTITNYISPEIENIFATNPLDYGDDSNSIVITFNQKMNSIASAPAESEKASAVDKVSNYTITPVGKFKLYLTDDDATSEALYNHQWNRLTFKNQPTIGEFSLQNPKINIGYANGPDINFVRSAYSDAAYKGNIYPLCDIKTPTLLVNKLDLTNDIIALDTNGDLKLTHKVSEIVDGSIIGFYNFFTLVSNDDFKFYKVSGSIEEELSNVSVSLEKPYDKANLLGGEPQVLKVDLPSDVFTNLSATDNIKMVFTPSGQSTDMFGKTPVTSEVVITVGDIMPAKFESATLVSNDDADQASYYKLIGIDVNFTNDLKVPQTLSPSVVILTSSSISTNPSEILIRTIGISENNSRVINITAWIPKSDPCNSLTISSGTSDLTDSKGLVIDKFTDESVTKNI